MSDAQLIVLGIGNTTMGDDGVGPVVARMLQDRLPERAEIVIGELAGMSLVGHFLRGLPIVVVDAIATDAEPGSVFRFTPDECDIGSLRSNTLHGCGLPYIMMNARLAGAQPDVTIYAVQVGDVRPRPDTLTPKVAHAAERVAELVEADVESRLAVKSAG